MIKLRFFSILVMVMLLLATACGVQPQQAARNGSSDQAASAVTGAEKNHQDNETEKNGHAGETAAIDDLTPVTLAEGQKLQVVATTSIVGDLVSNVGGDLIELTTLVPLGSDPHTFSPTPQDVASVADAHVVFANGLGLEEFLQPLIENAGGDAVVVPVSAAVETIEFGGTEEEARHAHGSDDPHVWTTPANAVVMVQAIEEALSTLDPAHADSYKASAEAYAAELNALDSWVMAQIQSIPAENRKMVTDHDSFRYYADRYGLELIGAIIPSYSSNAEPSAQELAELQDAINQTEVNAVFVGTSVNPVLAERIAEDTGVQLAPLYTGSLGEPGSGAETYVDYIRYDTQIIVDALK